MPEGKTEQFLEAACADIRDRRTREEVKQELRSHILEKADDLIISGYSADEAEERAVAQMGDAKRLARELGELHSFFPLRRFKNALTLFYIGFLLTSFQINVGIFDEICVFVGNCLLFLSCFLLRKSDPLLQFAWIFEAVCLAAQTAQTVLLCVPPFPARTYLCLSLTVLGSAAAIARMFLFGYGIARFSQGAPARGAKSIGYLYAAEYLCLLLATIVAKLFVVFLLFFAVFVLLVLFILRKIRLLSRDLWTNDREVKLAKPTRAGTAVLCLLLAATLAAMPCTCAIVFYTPPAQTEFSARDVSGEELGFVQEIKSAVQAAIPEENALGKEIAEQMLQDVADSDWLRLYEPEETQNIRLSFFSAGYGRKRADVYSVHYDDEKNVARVTHLSYSVYEADAHPLHSIRDTFSYTANILSDDQTPVRFVQLHEKGGTIFQTRAAYVSVNSASATAEYKLPEGNARAYAVIDLLPVNSNHYINCTQNAYVYTSFLRYPYEYDIENYGADPNWLQIVSYVLLFEL